MVNLDSDLAREHPDWLLAEPGRVPRTWRHQHLLDLGRSEVREHLLARLDALVTEYDLDFLKWDHNRDLHEAVHAPTGQAGVHAHTLGVYRLLDDLRARHPGLEIESCASGGARVDLGVLERTDRVWASDTNDALERQRIQRWTGQLLPPELVGSHVGPPVAHTSGRLGTLAFRCLTALFGHAGLEWDLTTAGEDDLATLTAWSALYRELRPLLHSGDVVRADTAEEDLWLHGVVAADRSEAALALVRLDTSAESAPGRLRLPGLDPARRYRVTVREELAPPVAGIDWPGWWGTAPVLPGSVLAGAGLSMPVLHPGSGLLLHLTAVDATDA
jgi:alpha-galactosidase